MPSAAWRRSTGGRCEPTIGHVGPVRLRLSRVFAAAFAAVVAAVHLTTGLRLRLLMSCSGCCCGCFCCDLPRAQEEMRRVSYHGDAQVALQRHARNACEQA